MKLRVVIPKKAIRKNERKPEKMEENFWDGIEADVVWGDLGGGREGIGGEVQGGGGGGPAGLEF